MMKNTFHENDLFDAAILTVTDPLERIAKALRWCGFTARVNRSREEIELYGPHSRNDFRLLERHGIAFEKLKEPQNEFDTIRQFSVWAVIASDTSDSALRKLFTKPYRHGMCAVEYENPSDSWSFLPNRTHFINPDIEPLDPSIALLVRVLPLTGLRSILSCDGHGTERPHIQMGKQTLEWPLNPVDYLSQGVLQLDLLTRYSLTKFQREWEWDVGTKDGAKWFLAKTPVSPDLESRLRFCEMTELLALAIIFHNADFRHALELWKWKQDEARRQYYLDGNRRALEGDW